MILFKVQAKGDINVCAQIAKKFLTPFSSIIFFSDTAYSVNSELRRSFSVSPDFFLHAI